MKLAVNLLRLNCAIAILGFLGISMLPVIAPEKVPTSVMPKILPYAPKSDERWALIETFKKRAPALIKQFSFFTYTNNHGEIMPYRLFTPCQLESGYKYPLVVFLHEQVAVVLTMKNNSSVPTGLGDWCGSYLKTRIASPALLWPLKPMSTGLV